MLAPADCKITVQPGEPPLVVVVGEVNYEFAPRIAEVFAQIEQNGQCRLNLDCSAVEFIDSSGIGVIVHWAQKLQKAGGGIKLQAAAPQLKHALSLMGFADQLCPDEIVTQSPETQRWVGVRDVRRRARLCVPLPADRNGLVRRQVAELAQTMPFTTEQIDDIRLAVGEAVSNAIRHGCKDKNNDWLKVDCSGDKEKLVVSIHSPGEPFDPNAIPTPDPCNPREGGMGIYFMRLTMDEVEFDFDETGTTVTLTKFITTGR